jgi:hypothetical protein
VSTCRPFRREDYGLARAAIAAVAVKPGPEPQNTANTARGIARTSAPEAASPPVARDKPRTDAAPSPTPPLDGPADWRAALLALSPDHDPCPGFRPDTWARVWASAPDFLDRHGEEAERLGWTANELCGVHPVVGVIRVDFCGALMLTVPGRVASVEAKAIRYTGGLVYRRSAMPSAAVPVWAFGRPKRPSVV